MMEWLVFVLLLCAAGLFREGVQLGAARLCKLPVERFSIGFGRPIWQRISARTGTTFQVTSLPIGAFVHVRDAGHAAAKRFATISSALAATYLAVCLVALAYFAIHGLEAGEQEIGVRNVLDGYDAAGKLQPGDRIVAVESEPLRAGRGSSLSERVNARGGAPVTLTIRRGGATHDVTVAPGRDESSGRWLLGIRQLAVSDRTRELGPVVVAAVRYPVQEGISVVRRQYDLVFGAESGELAGPVKLVEELQREFDPFRERALRLTMTLGVYFMLLVIAFDLFRLGRLAIELVRPRPPAPATR